VKNKPEGFTFRATRGGLVTIWYHGRQATQLKGPDAAKFISFSEKATEDELQQRMARLTGNYKRGNERSSK